MTYDIVYSSPSYIEGHVVQRCTTERQALHELIHLMGENHHDVTKIGHNRFDIGDSSYEILESN